MSLSDDGKLFKETTKLNNIAAGFGTQWSAVNCWKLGHYTLVSETVNHTSTIFC